MILEQESRTNDYYIWSTIDYGITDTNGRVMIKVDPRNPGNYLLVTKTGKDIKAFQTKEDMSSLNIDQPAEVSVPSLVF